MAVKLYRHNVIGLKQMMVSDSTDKQTAWDEIESAVNQNLNIVPFVVNPADKCPMQLITIEDFAVLQAAGLNQVNDSEIQAIADAYQAANP